MNIKYLTLYFDNDAVKSGDLEPAISIDHVNRLSTNINTLRQALGITSMKPMAEGALVKVYKTTVTKFDKQAAEGEVIPKSKAERKLTKTLTMHSELYNKDTTYQAIQSIGREVAINETDTALLHKIQTNIRNQFFETLTAEGATAVAGGSNLQEAIASAGDGVDEAFEDMDANIVYFINSSDFWDYKGKAPIATAQNLGGFRYVENFMETGPAFISRQIPKGFVYATARENLNGAYVPQGGAAAASFDLTFDESGMVGMTHAKNVDTGCITTFFASGVLFYVEDNAKVIKSPVNAVAGASDVG